MTTFDFSPLYRSTIGFDRLASLMDSVSASDRSQPSYPPYNIELVEDDKYRITMAVAGFVEDDISVETENNNLTVSASKDDAEDERKYLYQGIASRSFKRQFKLEDHVEVKSARLENGLLHIDLKREIPEAMRPRQISISTGKRGKLLESAA